MNDPFAVKDCALIAIATGQRAQTLRELRDRMAIVHPGSIYYHFWGRLLYPRFDDPEFQNDFASWAYHGLNDLVAAERLAVVNPAQVNDMEDLRRELVDIIDERLDETEVVPWSKADRQFHFIRSKIVVFEPGIRVNHPRELGPMIARLPVSVIFYHFIDARRRTANGADDFSNWLDSFGAEFAALGKAIREIDPYFISLAEMRSQVVSAFASHLRVGEE